MHHSAQRRSSETSPNSLRGTRREFDGRDARRAYLQLQGHQADRASKRARHHRDPLPTSDGEEDSLHPVIDTYRGESIGTEGVLHMTNFTPTEIVRIYGFVADYMATRWNVGRGKKCRYTAVDVFFTTLSVMKNGGDCAVLANSFGIKAPTFEKMIVHFLDLLSPHLYSFYVEQAARSDTMKKVVLSGQAFGHYPAARYSVDVTFQQGNMPSGTQAERAEYYSAKHKLHGFKTEVSVIPTGLAINCFHYRRGSVTYITIFRDNKVFHKGASTKKTQEEGMAEDGPLLECFPGSWIILADKGYQGLSDSFRVVHPKRRCPTMPLTVEEEATNRNISSDRIIVENYFGRLCTLWALCSDKYRWQEAKYEMYFRACVALTNMQVRAHPLCADDGEHYLNDPRRLNHIGTTRLQNKREANRRARERRLLRLATEVPPGEVGTGKSPVVDSLLTYSSVSIALKSWHLRALLSSISMERPCTEPAI